MPPDRPIEVRPWVRWFYNGERSALRTLTTSSLEVARALCEQGVGCAILPSRVAATSKVKLQIVDKGFPEVVDRIWFIYRMDQEKSPGAEALIEKVRKLRT